MERISDDLLKIVLLAMPMMTCDAHEDGKGEVNPSNADFDPSANQDSLILAFVEHVCNDFLEELEGEVEANIDSFQVVEPDRKLLSALQWT
jgi:hypothetical protein